MYTHAFTFRYLCIHMICHRFLDKRPSSVGFFTEATPGGSSQSTWETLSRIHPEESLGGSEGNDGEKLGKSWEFSWMETPKC